MEQKSSQDKISNSWMQLLSTNELAQFPLKSLYICGC